MNKPIYLVLTSYFPTPTTWRCAFVYDQVRAIQKTGRYRVVVVNSMAPEDYVYQGVEVWGLKTVRKGAFLCPVLYDAINLRRLMRVLKAHGLQAEYIAVVHCHMVTMATFAVGMKRRNPLLKLVVQTHDPDPYKILLSERWNCLGLKKYAYLRHHRGIWEKADIALCISRFAEDALLRFPDSDLARNYAPMCRALRQLSHCRAARVRRTLLLHNGVNRSLFNPTGRELHNGFIVGCIGNFIDWKDQMTLLRAVSQIKGAFGDWRLRLIGSGPYRAACEAFVREQGLEGYVIFESEVDHTLLPEFYRSLDLFVLPSYFEGFGCVFTEAWACGTPFITCEGQGMDDMILPEERHLWLCRPKDPEDLAEKILYFYRNRPEQHMAGSIDIDELVPCYLDALEQRGGRRMAR